MPLDTPPALDELVTLPADAARSYRRDGFAIVRGLASPEEVARFRPAIVAAAQVNNRETRPLAERGTYGRAFLQTPNLWQHDDTVRRFVFARRFAHGSHAGGALTELPIGSASQDELSRIVRERGFAVDGPARMRAGDATFHAGRTLHGAPPNGTERTREVMTVIWFADGTRVGGSDHPTRAFDLVAWLPGLGEGEPAASALNPLLWSARDR